MLGFDLLYLLLNVRVLKYQRGRSDVFLTHALAAAEINGMLDPLVDLLGC